VRWGEKKQNGGKTENRGEKISGSFSFLGKKEKSTQWEGEVTQGKSRKSVFFNDVFPKKHGLRTWWGEGTSARGRTKNPGSSEGRGQGTRDVKKKATWGEKGFPYAGKLPLISGGKLWKNKKGKARGETIVLQNLS